LYYSGLDVHIHYVSSTTPQLHKMISIVIPHRGNSLGLWSTVHSCEAEFTRRPLEREYVIVSNGEKIGRDVDHWLKPLVDSGKAKHIHHDEAVSPPKAREEGVAAASGELVFCFDNHCIVAPDYFARSIIDFDHYRVDCLHSSTRYHTSNGTDYHYRLRLPFNFWAESVQVPESDYKPYECAAAGHGGFAVRKSVWQAVGGYGPEHLLKGYAGEELIFDLKLWRLGYKVHIDPQVVHYHFAGNRGYARHYGDDYYTNLLTCAFVIGGESWLYKVYESFSGLNGRQHIRIGKGRMFDLMVDAYDRGKEYAEHLDSIAKYTLDTLLTEVFPRNGVVF
jgi:hypothetical protein